MCYVRQIRYRMHVSDAIFKEPRVSIVILFKSGYRYGLWMPSSPDVLPVAHQLFFGHLRRDHLWPIPSIKDKRIHCLIILKLV